MPLRLTLMASGTGSNVQAIVAAIQSKKLDADIIGLICNNPTAPVIAFSQSQGIPTYVIPHHGKTREAHEAEILNVLFENPSDYLVLAGYMRLFTPGFFKQFETTNTYRVVNIHPSLLPAFPGAHAYQDAFDYGVKISGITVHFVDEAMDHGPIIVQDSFPRLDEDTLETFQARGLTLEHQLYPQALQALAQGQVDIRKSQGATRPYVQVRDYAYC